MVVDRSEIKSHGAAARLPERRKCCLDETTTSQVKPNPTRNQTTSTPSTCLVRPTDRMVVDRSAIRSHDAAARLPERRKCYLDETTTSHVKPNPTRNQTTSTPSTCLVRPTNRMVVDRSAIKSHEAAAHLPERRKCCLDETTTSQVKPNPTRNQTTRTPSTCLVRPTDRMVVDRSAIRSHGAAARLPERRKCCLDETTTSQVKPNPTRNQTTSTPSTCLVRPTNRMVVDCSAIRSLEAAARLPERRKCCLDETTTSQVKPNPTRNQTTRHTKHVLGPAYKSNGR